MSSPSSSVAGDQDSIVAKPVRSRHLTKISRLRANPEKDILARAVREKERFDCFYGANRRQSRGEKRRKLHDDILDT